ADVQGSRMRPARPLGAKPAAPEWLVRAGGPAFPLLLGRSPRPSGALELVLPAVASRLPVPPRTDAGGSDRRTHAGSALLGFVFGSTHTAPLLGRTQSALRQHPPAAASGSCAAGFHGRQRVPDAQRLPHVR